MNKRIPYTRRGFLKTSMATAAAAVFPAIIPGKALGLDATVAPSERIVLGHIGVGQRGQNLLGAFLAEPGVQVAAVCDVQRDMREAAQAMVHRTYENTDCASYNDCEELLAREDIDACCIASVDQWHVLHAQHAARAGKAIYLEKPVGLTIGEAQALRRVIEDTGVVFQFGTQQRSNRAFRLACEFVRNETLGPLKSIRAWAPPSESGGPLDPEPVPDELDYDRWLGPAPYTPYTRDRVSNDWWWFNSDYCLGWISAWGIHPVDIARWGAGPLLEGGVEVAGSGTFSTEGISNTATQWDLHCAYDSGVELHYISSPPPAAWHARYETDAEHGTAFECEGGWVHVNRRGMNASRPRLSERSLGRDSIRLYESAHHVKNFLDCVRSKEETICPVEEAVQSDIVCHYSDIALRLGRPVRWDPVTETFPGDEQANRMMHRAMRAPWKL